MHRVAGLHGEPFWGGTKMHGAFPGWCDHGSQPSYPASPRAWWGSQQSGWALGPNRCLSVVPLGTCPEDSGLGSGPGLACGLQVPAEPGSSHQQLLIDVLPWWPGRPLPLCNVCLLGGSCARAGGQGKALLDIDQLSVPWQGSVGHLLGRLRCNTVGTSTSRPLYLLRALHTEGPEGVGHAGQWYRKGSICHVSRQRGAGSRPSLAGGQKAELLVVYRVADPAAAP